MRTKVQISFPIGNLDTLVFDSDPSLKHQPPFVPPRAAVVKLAGPSNEHSST